MEHILYNYIKGGTFVVQAQHVSSAACVNGIHTRLHILRKN